MTFTSPHRGLRRTPRCLLITGASMAMLIALLMQPTGMPRAAAQPSETEQITVVCPVDAENVQPLTMGRVILGVSKCAECHAQQGSSGANGSASRSLLGGLLDEQANDTWVRKDELTTWYNNDRHAQAYATLLGDRSIQIGKNLGIAEVNRDARCLACHSTLPAANVDRDGNVIDAAYLDAKSIRDRVLLGVSCEACHGASGPDEAAAGGRQSGWWDVHIAKDRWRYKAPADKQDNFGYYDVRTPSSRAAMCLSCHLGDARQGRLVTHEMYAAGHPPLPNFELNSFVDMMPAHWRDLGSGDDPAVSETEPGALPGKKPKSLTKDFLTNTNDPYYRKLREQHPDFFKRIAENYESESCAATRSMAVGVLTAWTKNAALTRALMSPREYPLLAREGRWPELAQFECSACHHELRQADWRQEENAGKPGRPVLRDWATPLCRAILKALAPEHTEEFDRRQREIEVAATAQPYGDRALVDGRLEQAEAWLAKIIVEIQDRPFGRPEALAVLRGIAAVGAEGPLDYDAARQLTWAMKTTLDDVDPSGEWALVREQFDGLRQRFVLDLVDAKVRLEKREFEVGGAGNLPLYEIDLNKVLPTSAGHSGREVRDAFAQLSAALKADPP